MALVDKCARGGENGVQMSRVGCRWRGWLWKQATRVDLEENIDWHGGVMPNLRINEPVEGARSSFNSPHASRPLVQHFIYS